MSEKLFEKVSGTYAVEPDGPGTVYMIGGVSRKEGDWVGRSGPVPGRRNRDGLKQPLRFGDRMGRGSLSLRHKSLLGTLDTLLNFSRTPFTPPPHTSTLVGGGM